MTGRHPMLLPETLDATLIFHSCGLHNRFPTTASVCGEWTGNRVDDRSSQHGRSQGAGPQTTAARSGAAQAASAAQIAMGFASSLVPGLGLGLGVANQAAQRAQIQTQMAQAREPGGDDPAHAGDDEHHAANDAPAAGDGVGTGANVRLGASPAQIGRERPCAKTRPIEGYAVPR